MKYILIDLSILVSTSCKQRNEDQLDELAHFLQDNINESEPLAVVDFDKHEKMFIDDIENQIGNDLCYESMFTAEIELEKCTYRFPSFTFKRCDHWYGHHSSIDIFVNPNNQVIIHDWEPTKVPDGTSISNIIKTKTVYRFEQGDEPERIVYNINWSNETDSKFLEEITVEILKGIKAVADDLSIDFCQKKFTQLNEVEKEVIQAKFKWKLGFIGETYPVPPPPPPPPAGQTP